METLIQQLVYFLRFNFIVCFGSWWFQYCYSILLCSVRWTTGVWNC